MLPTRLEVGSNESEHTLIEARDLAQAVELSKGCAILEVDGAVEVRPIMKLRM
jgi:hypothetical protein